MLYYFPIFPNVWQSWYDIEYKKNCGHDIYYNAFSGIRSIKSFFPNQTNSHHNLFAVVITYSSLPSAGCSHPALGLCTNNSIPSLVKDCSPEFPKTCQLWCWICLLIASRGNYRRKNNPFVFEQQDTLKTDFRPINLMWIHQGAKLPPTTFN